MSSADWDLAQAFLDLDPQHAAMALERADVETVAAVLSRSPGSVVVGVLRQLDPSKAGQVLTHQSLEARSEALSGMEPWAAASILRTLETGEQERWLSPLPRSVARSLRVTLDFPPDTAGSLMDGDFFSLPITTTAGEARLRARKRARRVGNYLYVVDEDDRLLGVLSIGDLMVAASATKLGSLMRTPVEVLPARARTATILAHPGWQELHSLPIVDTSGALVGLLRREAYEQLRLATNGRTRSKPHSIGLELAELLWTWTAVALDELSGTVRNGGEIQRRELKHDD